ncbi:MAG: hypothetical protein DLM71_09905 [Chloroflexi bacterium]|nr:MAG: hypothetical protein DLM71_09905 [Chloroflexota bacterium]
MDQPPGLEAELRPDAVTPATSRTGRGTAVLAAGLIALGGCSLPASGASTGPTASGVRTRASSAPPVSISVTVPPVPGPVKPFRGEMRQHVYVARGMVSMYFELRNVGTEPVTFLNTLYDYEPTQLYTPAVRLEWREGGNAVYSRAGRFFPSPAVVKPGETAVYLMGGQPLSGSGNAGNLVTHIKYCPTRGMNDVPGIPLQVAQLAWRGGVGGDVVVTGTLAETEGANRAKAPTVGVAFFDRTGAFIGAVVATNQGVAIGPHSSRRFELTGGGVNVEGIAKAVGYAFIP